MDIEQLKKSLSYNQKTIIEVLASHPEGLLSKALTHKTGISNKSSIIDSKLREVLENNGLELYLKRKSKEWLWVLRPISENKE